MTKQNKKRIGTIILLIGQTLILYMLITRFDWNWVIPLIVTLIGRGIRNWNKQVNEDVDNVKKAWKELKKDWKELKSDL